MSITHWRLYLSCPIGEGGLAYVEISDLTAKTVQAAMKEDSGLSLCTIVTGREPTGLETSRTIYFNPNHVVALEPMIN